MSGEGLFSVTAQEAEEHIEELKASAKASQCNPDGHRTVCGANIFAIRSNMAIQGRLDKLPEEVALKVRNGGHARLKIGKVEITAETGRDLVRILVVVIAFLYLAHEYGWLARLL